MKKIALVVGLLFMLACEYEPEILIYSIDPELQPYLDRFYKEAESRGLVFEKENLEMKFSDELKEDVCGQCLSPKKNRVGQLTVEINRSGECWTAEADLNKEALVFHELGHCLLNRDHANKVFDSGAPKTIMTTYIDAPYGPCDYDIDGENSTTDCDKTNRRTWYLDELFGKNPAEPDWAR